MVKGLGDGIMATFASAADGVGAARAIQQTIHRHNRRGQGPELAVRIGLAVGDVTFEGIDCFGTPVVEAARLCSSADGHQILATDLLRGAHSDDGRAERGADRHEGNAGPRRGGRACLGTYLPFRNAAAGASWPPRNRSSSAGRTRCAASTTSTRRCARVASEQLCS